MITPSYTRRLGQSSDGLSILVIDDEESMILMLQKCLASLDWTLDFELKLEAGINRINTEHPDVTLLDLTFPESHAADTIRRIHSIADKTCVMVFTGDSGEGGLWKSCIDEGAMNFLQKEHYLDYRMRNSLKHAVWNSVLLHRRIYGSAS